MWQFHLLIFALSIVFLSCYGIHGRVMGTQTRCIYIKEQRNALSVWEGYGLKGRVLLSFDRNLNAENDNAALSDNNYIGLAVKRNVVRKIYHIIPDDAWTEVSANLAQYPVVSRIGGFFRMFLYDGTPVLIMRARDIRQIDEKILVNINGRYWTGQQLSDIVGLLRAKTVSSDVVTLSGNIPEEIQAELRLYEKTL